MTSSDYLVRKPNPLLFEIALQKAGLCGEEVWYCGDNPKADIEGAAQVGIYPIWYDNDLEKGNRDGSTKNRRPVSMFIFISGVKCWICWKR